MPAHLQVGHECRLPHTGSPVPDGGIQAQGLAVVRVDVQRGGAAPPTPCNLARRVHQSGGDALPAGRGGDRHVGDVRVSCLKKWKDVRGENVRV